ncbi:MULTISPECIES: hypothetical protein [Flavobacterium]|uniref:hypothetical protein n=1 Tax=Flavobacterium TaxID=237 RepID=UPI00095E19A7|nr:MULTISPECIES: hypothetical protein [Flavobacterium]MBN9283797.1 hypothetical protein [Flavobacterium sp.]OJV68697.1 MAG: hypothetical protein BGO42_02380 [Flavobacterium sp. 40-81]
MKHTVLKGLHIVMVLFVVLKNLWSGMAIMTEDTATASFFLELGFSNDGIMMLGMLAVACAGLILIPQTYIIGNLITASMTFLIICFNLLEENLWEAITEVPFLLLIVVMVRLNHPYINRYQWIDVMFERDS